MTTHRLVPSALIIAAGLALAGCSGGGSSAAQSTAAQSTGSAESSAAGSQATSAASSSAPSPSATASPKAYTTAELGTILAGLKDGEGHPLTAVPADQLETGIAAAKQMISAAVISPQECAALVDTSGQIPSGSTYTGGVAKSSSGQAMTTVTLVSVSDPSVLSKGAAAAKDNAGKCANYTIELQGKKITGKTEVLPVETGGDASFGSLTTQGLPDGQATQTAVVTGIKGSLSVSAVAIGQGVGPESATTLAKIVSDALAQG
ncbi:hypothetical protein [Arthrobacter sp. NPDC057259]|uniref:hypothetical protein n=1 Tax=Arthrobacter sp. NPDC057259 TaxID=3346073 RepID=UPI0036446B99